MKRSLSEVLRSATFLVSLTIAGTCFFMSTNFERTHTSQARALPPPPDAPIVSAERPGSGGGIIIGIRGNQAGTTKGRWLPAHGANKSVLEAELTIDKKGYELRRELTKQDLAPLAANGVALIRIRKDVQGRPLPVLKGAMSFMRIKGHIWHRSQGSSGETQTVKTPLSFFLKE